jgi:hypothetical protein
MRALVWNPLSCCPLVTAFYSRATGVLRPGGQVLFTAHFNEGNTYRNKYYVNDTYWYHPFPHSRVISLCLP